MSNNYQVKLPDGTKRHVADNQLPCEFDCPIDGTQLAERTEYDYTAYDCVTCLTPYQVRSGRINEEELRRQAFNHLSRSKTRLAEIEIEKSELLDLLELGQKTMGVLLV
jgi:hypothetical protein